jgi:phosphate:Na+ symporter
MRSLVHSTGAAAAITVTINKGGVLGEFPAMMSLAGLGIGTAIATYFLSSNLRGIPRQIAMYQGVTNIGGGVALAALLIVERFTGIPMLLSFANLITPSNAGHMAIVYLILNLLIAVIAIAGMRWAPHWLAKFSPPTPEEDLSRPMYLEPEALLSPETAPDLVALEQMRVMRVLEEYLEAVRSGDPRKLKALHNGAVTLASEITRFLEAMVQQPLATDLAARVISFQRKAETLRALEENVFLFAATLERRGSEELPGRLVEALDTILLTASDALKSKDPVDIDLLVSMTDDRGSTMERLRTRYRLENPERPSEVSALHYATTLFERNVWLLRQLALWIREDVKLDAV